MVAQDPGFDGVIGGDLVVRVIVTIHDKVSGFGQQCMAIMG